MSNVDVRKSTSPSKQKEVKRALWNNHLEYILSMIGSAVGLGNAWRFPYIAYKNGGGAFLIPYLLMTVFVGFTLFVTEVALGQFCSQGPLQAFNCVPLFRGLGLTIVLNVSFIGVYYNVVIAYALDYLINSFSLPLPWTVCTHGLSSPNCVELDVDNSTASEYICEKQPCQPVSASEDYWERMVLKLSSGIGDIGQVNVALLYELALVWLVVCLCTIRGVKSVGKAVYFTASFPYMVLTILLIGALVQEGASDGIYYFFLPDWSKLISAEVWKEAATQILLSLSIAVGGIMTLSSYNKFHSNCFKDAVIIISVNCFTSLFSGITIFAALGFMAKELNVDISKVVAAGPGLAFVAYPEIVSQLSKPRFFSIAFFLMMITLGLDTMFAVAETVVTTVSDSFPQRFHHKKELLTVGVCFVFFLCGIILVTQSGFYWLQLLDTYSGGSTLLWIGLIESVIIAYVYGINRFCEDIEMMTGEKTYSFYKYTMQFITPTAFLVVAISSTAQHKRLSFKGQDFPIWADVVGWLLVALVFGFIPVFAVYELMVRKGDFWKVSKHRN